MKMFPLIVAVFNVLTIILLIQMSQEIIYWPILVSICARISKYDAKNSVSVDLP